MKALDTYKNLLRELDKWESATFTVNDFNYFYPSAIQEYLTENYLPFDVRQKDLDDIRAILVLNHPITSFTNGKASIPEEYRHMLHLEVVLKVLANEGDYLKDDIVTVFPKRLKTNQKGFAQENSYQNPSIDYSHFQVDKDSIYILAGSNVEIQSARMDYLEEPALVYLNPDTTVSYDQEENNTTMQFPDYVLFEINKVCKRIFLENFESQRYASSLQEEQLRKQSE